MHYSKYIKTNRKPVVDTPPVRETYVEPVLTIEPLLETIKMEEPKQRFPQVDPDKIDQIWVSQENAPPTINVNTETHYNDPLLEDFHQFLMNASKSDIVTKQNTRKLLKYLVDYLKGELSESETMLSEDEATDIMIYMKHLEDEVFPDIPIREELPKLFVWNIPRELYDGMVEAINNNVPDILNPIVPLYLSLTDYPDKSIGQFYLDIDKNLRFDHENDIRQSADEYKKWVSEDEEIEDAELVMDETDDDE
jgi:hypothetical protein